MPASKLGRSFWALLMPGPGRGYLFSMACMFSCSLVIFFIHFCWEWMLHDPTVISVAYSPFPFASTYPLTLHALVYVGIVFMSLMAFPAMFMSTTYLLLSLYRRVSGRRLQGAGGPLFGLLVAAFVWFGVSMASAAFDSYYYDANELSQQSAWNWYEVIQYVSASNREALNNTVTATPDFSEMTWSFCYSGVNLVPVYFVASISTALAIFVASREMRFGVMATPERVEKDIEQAAEPEEESIDDALGIVDEETSSSKS